MASKPDTLPLSGITVIELSTVVTAALGVTPLGRLFLPVCLRLTSCVIHLIWMSSLLRRWGFTLL